MAAAGIWDGGGAMVVDTCDACGGGGCRGTYRGAALVVGRRRMEIDGVISLDDTVGTGGAVAAILLLLVVVLW